MQLRANSPGCMLSPTLSPCKTSEGSRQTAHHGLQAVLQDQAMLAACLSVCDGEERVLQ